MAVASLGRLASATGAGAVAATSPVGDSGVGATIVSEKVLVYHSITINLNYYRAVHRLVAQGCPECNLARLTAAGQVCNAIHYGACTDLVTPILPHLIKRKLQSIVAEKLGSSSPVGEPPTSLDTGSLVLSPSSPSPPPLPPREREPLDSGCSVLRIGNLSIQYLYDNNNNKPSFPVSTVFPEEPQSKTSPKDLASSTVPLSSPTSAEPVGPVDGTSSASSSGSSELSWDGLLAKSVDSEESTGRSTPPTVGTTTPTAVSTAASTPLTTALPSTVTSTVPAVTSTPDAPTTTTTTPTPMPTAAASDSVLVGSKSAVAGKLRANGDIVHKTNEQPGQPAAQPSSISPRAKGAAAAAADVVGEAILEAKQPIRDKKSPRAMSPPAVSKDKPAEPTATKRPAPKMPDGKSARSQPALPQFHFPFGRPMETKERQKMLNRVIKCFNKLLKASPELSAGLRPVDFGPICKELGVGTYWRSLFHRKALANAKKERVRLDDVKRLVNTLLEKYHDDAARFVYLASRQPDGSGSLSFGPDDLADVVQDIIDNHPGLVFLRDASQFHEKYTYTVIHRVFFAMNRSWSSRITIPEMRQGKPSFIKALNGLDDEEDINRELDFFSYEHFYVIFCRFWELDADKDLLITKQDLAIYDERALSNRILDRLFQGICSRDRSSPKGYMSYYDFVYFLIAEKAKSHSTSIEFWFRLMDLDGDGKISLYEMDYFYEEQMQKMDLRQGPDSCANRHDCLIQMLDMIRPANPNYVTLSDLKRCGMASTFFNMMFNIERLYDLEHRPQFGTGADVQCSSEEIKLGMWEWDQWAADQYEMLMNDEGMDEEELGPETQANDFSGLFPIDD